MTVTRITTLNEDPRFFFEGFDPLNPPVLRSGRLTNLGRIIFSPSAPCEHEYCYLGMPLGSTDGAWFIHGLGLPSNLPEIDSYLYKNLRRKYEALVKNGKHHVNTTIILDTDKAKNIKIKTSAELVWPRLLTRNSIHFPLTALGNFTIVNLTLANPTQVPVAIQVIPLVIYPDAESLVELMRPHLASDLTDHVEMNETLMFSLRDTELFTLKPDSPVPKLREAFEHHLNHDMARYNGEINIPRFTLSMILRPNTKVRLRLGFLPSDYTLRSSLLLIRNNLTGIEPVVMYGKGARIGVKVEGVEARSKKPLLFEIRHDHLTDCNNPKRLMHKLHSTLTVRRPFQVMNSGEVQFTVTNMSINGVPCENRGFRILNCYPFRLQPNETYALDIAYTPDFLTTTNEADLQLYMHMNGSAWLFPLAATVPGDMLAKCHQALPRPPFENIMYYSCVTALIFCLVCVLACAYLEGDRAIACAIRQQFAVPRHVFDLNNLKPTPTPATAASANPAQSKEISEADKKKWRIASAPSTLRASSDAWWISRFLISLANWVVQCVHSVWKCSFEIS
uniref:Transmembrane protein n=1 Tax=Caenorhabditis japonica TaxID=281687 RepID=A0A8R1IPW0_CAEJA